MVSRDEARELARAECERHGLAFDEPIRVNGGPLHYSVWTRADARGGNAIVSVHRWTGAVELRTVTPR